MTWPPQIGDPLPRADRAWCEPTKLDDWVLAERGRGAEWRRVFQIGLEDRELFWSVIVAAIQPARIDTIRDRGEDGFVFGIDVALTIRERTAPVTICWHYASEDAPPRLVTAYVKL